MKWEMRIIIILIIISIITETSEIIFHNTNELISTISSYAQTICIIIQSIILLKQLKLSEKTDEKSRAENKGIFMLEKSNIKNRCPATNNKYNLRVPIALRNIGNDHVIVKGQKINENDLEICEGTFFTNQKEYSKFYIDLKLTEEDFQKEIISCVIELKLENLKGYEYTEIIDCDFIREEKESAEIYNLNKFNIKLIEKN